MGWLRRLRGTVFGSQVDATVAEETRFHLDARTAEYMKSGMLEDAARQRAARRFGNVTLAGERTRDVDSFRRVRDLSQDFQYALRQMRRAPGFTIVAIATLVLGIGANTAIFSVVNTVLLKPLPYPDPNRLMVFLNTFPQGSGPGASPTKFNVWRRQTTAFQDVSAYRFNVINRTDGNDPEQLPAAWVSADFFRLFGAPLMAGRTFNGEEDRPNGGHVIVLGEGFWKRRFGGDATVVGRSLSLNGEPYVVIGILGPFDTEPIQSPAGPPDIWLPFQLDPNSTMQGHYFLAAGRLRPAITVGMANAQLRLAANEFREKFPDAMDPDAGFAATPFQELIVGDVRSSLAVLGGAVSFILLIACANVANLLLLSASARQREIAVRAAIGAGRGRLMRQLLTESVVLSLIAGALGTGLGMVGIRALLTINPGDIPRIGANGASVNVDGHVLAFTLVVSLMTGLFFGLAPALHASRPDLMATLNESNGRSWGGFRQHRMRALLVVSEVGLALWLLVGAGLFIRTFLALRRVDPGFDAHHVLTMDMSLTGARFAQASAVAQLMRDGVERLNALPAVEVAGAACCVPLQGGFGLPFIIQGRPLSGPAHGGGSFTPIAPTYFRVFRIPLIRGRTFTDRDQGGTPGVAIINQTMARQYWPTADPLRDQITIGQGLGPGLELPARQIVGIVGDVRDGGLNFTPGPTMYVPWAQMPDGHSANLLEITPLAWIVRTRGEPLAARNAIQQELRHASGGLPVAHSRTMDDVVGRSTARINFNMVLMTIFGAAALLLAAIGIYGLMAYSVQQRTQEIGIRVALGADATQVRNMVVGQGMRLALVGVALGLLLALGLARLLATFVFGITVLDPLVFVSVPTLLAAVALGAVWVPARRASRVDPAVALRAE